MTTVAVLGAGTAGTALAQVAAGNGHSVHLWSIETDVLAEIRDHDRNTKYLPGLALNPLIQPCCGLEEALAGAGLAALSVPTHVLRAVAREAAPHLKGEPIVLSMAKGLEAGTNLRMSQVLAQELRPPAVERIASMGGPAIAVEFARGAPTAVIVASENVGAAAAVQKALQNEYFKVETSRDVVGLELGATLKNAYAISLGMCDGLGHGTNAKAFMATLALEEMATLMTALGGEPRTAYGLAGLGDLLTTGYSPHSRNRTLGEKLCTDQDWRQFLERATVEGVTACRAARELAKQRGLDLPLLDAVYEVLFQDKLPSERMHLFLQEFSYK